MGLGVASILLSHPKAVAACAAALKEVFSIQSTVEKTHHPSAACVKWL
jgi:hypothetical protein